MDRRRQRCSKYRRFHSPFAAVGKRIDLCCKLFRRTAGSVSLRCSSRGSLQTSCYNDEKELGGRNWSSVCRLEFETVASHGRAPSIQIGLPTLSPASPG